MATVPYRMETDSLGQKEVPLDAYYGIQTVRALENFPISSYSLSPSFIQSVAQIKQAAARANQQQGTLDEQLGLAIEQACQEMIDGQWLDQFVVDPIQGGAGTSINMNANEVIANRALEILGKEKGRYDILSPNSHVNQAQSTNDVIPTAFRLTLLKEGPQLFQALQELEHALLAKSQEFDGLLKMGRTHLQDAVPIRLGQEFSAYAQSVKRAGQRISAFHDQFLSCNMGATAVGTAITASTSYMDQVLEEIREISGFKMVLASNLVDATQNTDLYADFSASLKTSMLALSKIANDLRLMASGPRAGWQELELPQRQAGSSIMPGKINPVMAEVMNQIAFQVIGNDATVSAAVEAGQFELNVMAPVIIHNILESVSMMTQGIRVFTNFCVAGIQAHAENMEDQVQNSIGIITALCPAIGYEKATHLAKEALETDQNIPELIEEKQLFSMEEQDRLLDPMAMTNPSEQ